MARAPLEARFPPGGAQWPAAMRADMAAAYLDLPDTRALAAAVRRGEAPPPTSSRIVDGRREPVWSKADLERFLAPARDLSQPTARQGEDLLALI